MNYKVKHPKMFDLFNYEEESFDYLEQFIFNYEVVFVISTAFGNLILYEKI